MEREYFQTIIIIDEMIQLGLEGRIGVWQLFEKDDQSMMLECITML
jgi:hypothetical protein